MMATDGAGAANGDLLALSPTPSRPKWSPRFSVQDRGQATYSLAIIENALFGANTTTKVLICNFNNEPIGFAVYFFNFSTWLGKHGLYLEDLYVSPEYRGVGAGKALLKHLASIAVSKECGRFEWNVLDWNQPAIQFYESIGAKPQHEWVGYRLTGEALEAFAGS